MNHTARSYIPTNLACVDAGWDKGGLCCGFAAVLPRHMLRILTVAAIVIAGCRSTNPSVAPDASAASRGTEAGDGECFYEGRIYTVGDSFPAVDGCNTCQCTESGVGCSKMACEPCDGEVVDDQTDCLMDDAFCYEMENGLYCTGPQAPECPDGYRRLAAGETCVVDAPLCFMFSEGLYCQLNRRYTVDECEAAGGEALSDPGDGSLVATGCPDNRSTMGFVEGFIEGGLCCGD